MAIKQEQQDYSSMLAGQILSFVNRLDSFNSRQDVIRCLLETLNSTFEVKFLSFIEKTNHTLQVLCQLGNSDSIKNIFNEDACSKIFDWVLEQQQPASLKIGDNNNFIFIPVYEYIGKTKTVYGLTVMYLADSSLDLSNVTGKNIKLLSKLAASAMTKCSFEENSGQNHDLDGSGQTESEYFLKVQNTLSGSGENKKILLSVLEDKEALRKGSFWWVRELGADTVLVLTAQADDTYGSKNKFCDSALAMLGGYIMGEMNGLTANTEVSMNPGKAMKYLNEQLNALFKSTGIVINAWYGVFSLGTKKVRYANANHPAPFLIGPEQQVSNLEAVRNKKNNALGLNLNSEYEESVSYISSKSKLVICNGGLVEQAATIGHKYDPSWLPQVLETLGALPINEMNKNLQSILSENMTGTALKSSRLALLLEMPS